MAEYHIDVNNGLDTNTGTTEGDAFRTITKFASICTHDDIGLVYSGQYNEGYLNFRSLDRVVLRGQGNVIVNCGGFDYFIDNMDHGNMENLIIKNWAISLSINSLSTRYRNCQHCMDGIYYLANSGTLIADRWDDAYFHRCTFFGVENIADSYSTGIKEFFDCIIEKATIVDSGNVFVNCASDNASVYGDPGCFNTATYPAPFIDVSDPTDPDLSFDRDHAQYSKYISGGVQNGCVGYTGRPMVGWKCNYNNKALYQHVGTSDNRGLGLWENDTSYYDKTWENRIVSSANANNKIYFVESGGSFTATIADGTYTSGALYALAVQSALNAVGLDIKTVSHQTNLRQSISSDGSLFELTCTNNTDAAWSDMGIDTDADKTGGLLYQSDHGICVGPGAGAESNASPVEFNAGNYGFEIDFGVEPEGTNGRVVSTIIDRGGRKLITGITLEYISDGTGGIDSSQASSTRHVEIRADNSLFTMHDAAGSTELDWTPVEYPMVDLSGVVTSAYRYWQVRVMPRTNLTA